MIGLSLKDVQGLSTEEQMRKISSAMEATEDPAKKLAAAAGLFKDSKFVSYLEGGTKAIDEFMDESKRVGTYLTDEQASNMESAGDQIDKVGRSWTGLARQIAAEAAPLIIKYAHYVVDGVVWLKDRIVDAIHFVSFTIENWPAVWDIAVTSTALQLTTLWEDVKHTFVDIIQAIFTGFYKGTESFFGQLGGMIKEHWGAIAVWLASGGLFGDIEFVQKPLLDSFDIAFNEVKKAIPRQLSDVEKELQSELDKKATALGQKWFDFNQPKGPEEPRKSKAPGIPNEDKAAKDKKGGQLGLYEFGSQATAEIIAKIRSQPTEAERAQIKAAEILEQIKTNTEKSADATDDEGDDS